MTIDEMIEVMQAYRDGAKIESKIKGATGVWAEAALPLWDWSYLEYRVKKEPVRVRLYRHDKNDPWTVVNESFGLHPDAEVITVEQVDD